MERFEPEDCDGLKMKVDHEKAEYPLVLATGARELFRITPEGNVEFPEDVEISYGGLNYLPTWCLQLIRDLIDRLIEERQR